MPLENHIAHPHPDSLPLTINTDGLPHKAYYLLSINATFSFLRRADIIAKYILALTG